MQCRIGVAGVRVDPVRVNREEHPCKLGITPSYFNGVPPSLSTPTYEGRSRSVPHEVRVPGNRVDFSGACLFFQLGEPQKHDRFTLGTIDRDRPNAPSRPSRTAAGVEVPIGTGTPHDAATTCSGVPIGRALPERGSASLGSRTAGGNRRDLAGPGLFTSRRRCWMLP